MQLIGHEISGVYDGVLFWVCTADDFAFQRFTYPHMVQKAEPYIKRHNKANKQKV